MRTRSLFLSSLILILVLFLSACAGTAPTVTIDQVQTVAALTFQAMTSQPVDTPLPPTLEPTTAVGTTAGVMEPSAPASTAATSAPALTPTPTPVKVQPRGSFIPYPTDSCEALRAGFESTLGAPVMIESVPFSDRVTGRTGTACRVHATGTSATYTMAGGPFTTLLDQLGTFGWTEDGINYGAGGPTGLATGFRKGGALGLLHVGWRPSEDANCPKDQPISMCDLKPEQKLWDITFDVADMVIYNPPTEEQCASAQAVIQPVIPIPLKMEIVDFTDFELNRGTACQVRADGNGITFTGVGETAQAIDNILIPLGWILGNGADGPTGTGREYTLGDLVAVVFVKWVPAPDANCPKDQPISACPLTPGQKLYTVMVTFGQK